MTVAVEKSNEAPVSASPSSSSSPNLNPADNNNDVVVPPVPVDRNWLRKLIQKHEKDERLIPYYQELHAKYPILKDKALVVAPMVDQSDLPFRLLCRNYGTNLCFTPMVHAKMYHQKVGYRRKFWSHTNGTPASDRPLIVQLCGSDLEHLLFTIKDIVNSKNGVDGIDLNCGCPQTIAKRGQYGAFLLEQNGGDTVVNVVKRLVEQVGHIVPISVKVRILPSGIDDSLKLYGRLVDAGASMLTIHGRTRLQKGLKTGASDWDTIKRVMELYGDKIPILANGGISNLDDVRECLEHTGVDGIMSSEGILEYPALFTESNTIAVDGKRVGPGRLEMTREYLKLSMKHPPDHGGQGNGIKCVRAHVHRFLHEDLKGRNDIRQKIALAQDHDVLYDACNDIEKIYKELGHIVQDEELSWYMRHRVVKDGTTALEKKLAKNKEVNQFSEEQLEEMKDEKAGCIAHLFTGDSGGGGDDQCC